MGKKCTEDRDLEERLRELEVLGVVTWASREREPWHAFEPIQSDGLAVSEALLDEREDRF
jgi:hypothetical protein